MEYDGVWDVSIICSISHLPAAAKAHGGGCCHVCRRLDLLYLSEGRANFGRKPKGVNGKSLSVELEIFENIHRICYNDIHTLYYHTLKHTDPLKIVGQLTSHYQPPFWDPHPCTLGGQLGELGCPIKARSQWRRWNLQEETYIVCMMVYHVCCILPLQSTLPMPICFSMSRTTFSSSLAT